MKQIFIFIAAMLICASCGNKSNMKENIVGNPSTIEIRNAKGFNVRNGGNGIRLVDVKDPQKGNSRSYHFALVPHGNNSKTPDGYTRIEVPIKRTILPFARFA